MLNKLPINPGLIQKYNRPVPRYTSYPTVPYWEDQIDETRWKETFSEQFTILNVTNGISIYIHLPFCESLCTYCGCNKKITTNHSVEEPYLLAVEKEWKQYRALMGQPPVIREIHLGGGTPTFFSAGNLIKLLKGILKNSIVHPMHEFSIEGHPNNTTKDQLKALVSLGFRRISYGVQDLDSEVQRVINRIQTFETVKRATEDARAAGFDSVNFDLIYGLPMQTVEGLGKTIRKVLALRPDRIAFYSYAHVPWTSRGQRLFNDAQLPGPEKKIELYMKGQALLMENGYHDIGMDHFSLPADALYKARINGQLHRNFMGYTSQKSDLLLGLGVSSISDMGNAYAQNKKTLQDYYLSINTGKLAIKRGYFLSEEDIAFRQYIKDISCKGFTDVHPDHLAILETFCFPQLDELVSDGLVEYNKTQVMLTPIGHYFIRNVCSAFDLCLQRDRSLLQTSLFSKAI